MFLPFEGDNSLLTNTNLNIWMIISAHSSRNKNTPHELGLHKAFFLVGKRGLLLSKVTMRAKSRGSSDGFSVTVGYKMAPLLQLSHPHLRQEREGFCECGEMKASHFWFQKTKTFLWKPSFSTAAFSYVFLAVVGSNVLAAREAGQRAVEKPSFSLPGMTPVLPYKVKVLGSMGVG